MHIYGIHSIDVSKMYLRVTKGHTQKQIVYVRTARKRAPISPYIRIAGPSLFLSLPRLKRPFVNLPLSILCIATKAND